MEGLLKLSAADLRAVASRLRSGRLTTASPPSTLSALVSPALVAALLADLQTLEGRGLNNAAITECLEVAASAKAQRSELDEVVELVTTGPEIAGVTNRDTFVVVEDLFRNATTSVLIAGYELYRSQSIFRTLAERMAAVPSLKVQMFLNVKRAIGDTSASSQIVAGFGAKFRKEHWPHGAPLPEIYYDPRSLEPGSRAVLHAKSIVVDESVSFVSSANFTESAQQRNIEVGLLVRSAILASRIVRFFAAMRDAGAVERVL